MAEILMKGNLVLLHPTRNVAFVGMGGGLASLHPSERTSGTVTVTVRPINLKCFRAMFLKRGGG